LDTNENYVTYPIKDLPHDFISKAVEMPDFSPRKRHFSFDSQFLKVQTSDGKNIDFPVWPIVVSNRLYVDVAIPYINERRRIIMDTNLEMTLTNLPIKWDINYNSNRFEIVNQDTNPILQVVYSSPSEVHVNGVYIIDKFEIYEAFDSPDTTFSEQIIFGGLKDTQFYKMNIDEFEKAFKNIVFVMDSNSVYNAKFPEQKAIFKYPSWQFYHQLSD